MTPRFALPSSHRSRPRFAAGLLANIPLTKIPLANVPLMKISLTNILLSAFLLTVGIAAAAPPQAASAETASVARWVPPVAVPFEVVEPFRAPEHAYGPGHRGIDLAARAGAEVRVPVGGTVTFAGTVVDRPVISVRVDETTVYSMEPVSSTLRAGDTVDMGALIGTVSDQGHCGGHCVHLGVRINGDYVNPLRYFVTKPVLLPW